MLWDASFQSWAELGVSLQPSAHLYAADGTLLRRWLGPFDEGEVLALVGADTARSAVPSAPTATGSGSAARFCRYVERFVRAQADASGWATTDAAGRKRIVDDLRFAANAMAQTAPVEMARVVDSLAAAARADGEALVDAGLPADPAGAPGRVERAGVLVRSLQEASTPLSRACGVEVAAVASP